MSKRTVKITESEFEFHLRSILFEEVQCDCEERQVVKEDFTSSEKNEIKNVIRDFLNMSRSGSFEATVKALVKDYIKTDKELEKHFVEINKNVLVQLYKTLWTRRGFWTNDLKNQAS